MCLRAAEVNIAGAAIAELDVASVAGLPDGRDWSTA
jgi:hypothetical protein